MYNVHIQIGTNHMVCPNLYYHSYYRPFFQTCKPISNYVKIPDENLEQRLDSLPPSYFQLIFNNPFILHKHKNLLKSVSSAVCFLLLWATVKIPQQNLQQQSQHQQQQQLQQLPQQPQKIQPASPRLGRWSWWLRTFATVATCCTGPAPRTFLLWQTSGAKDISGNICRHSYTL